MIRKLLIATVLLCGAALAQGGPGAGGPGMDGPQRGGFNGPRKFDDGDGGHPLMAPGRWWKRAEVAKQLGLDDAQIQKIEQIFQDSRLKLVDLHANLQKDEIKLEPMIEADNPDENAVLSAIDRIASDRAALVKANAQMAFAIRRVLTPEQWKKLRTIWRQHDRFPQPMGGPRDGMRHDGPPRHGMGGPGMGGPGGPEAGAPPAPEDKP
jgi:Spy/CpxP family protein refolding chaperone